MFNALPSRLRGLRRRAGSLTDDRGQSLVELAMALPIILLLTLVALDFGRVYLGYINLQNMTRIAANYAANKADAWVISPNPDIQNKYKNQILADASATNCQLPVAGGAPVVAMPSFTDSNGDGSVGDLGDKVTVSLTCTFGVITPFISNILGGSVAVSAESSFPVKSGMSYIAGGGAVPVGVPPNAAFLADTTATPNSLTVVGPTVSVDFHDTSGGYPTAWAWDFGDGTTSNQQDPLQHPYNCPVASCTRIVKLKASNLSGSSETSMSVTIIGDSTVNFTADKQTGSSPLTVTFTDASTPGGTAWKWDFGDGQTGSGTPVSHTYTKSGATYNVSLTVTYPSPVGDVSVTKTAYISTDAALCTIPSLNGVHINDATAVWQGSPWNFTGSVIVGPNAPNGNFAINQQSLVAGEVAPCSSDVTVNHR